MELWKDIDGFEEYQISTWGNVRRNGRLIKPYLNHKGYLKVQLWKKQGKRNKRVNRLVAQAFIPNPNNYPQVNHKDGNKQNNSITNLEWVTGEMNIEHAKRLKKGIIS